DEGRNSMLLHLQDESRERFSRRQGMIEDDDGRAVVAETQRMCRAGMTDIAQLDFLERLGQIRAAMMLEEMAAIPRREVALGWTVVGRLLMIEQLSGHTQERLGSAVRDGVVLSAMGEVETPVAQESLGSA